MKRMLLLVLCVAAAVLAAAPAWAHPLGNFTVNTYGGIELSPAEVRVTYVVDMAEVPSFQELRAMDTDGDGVASDAELRAWAPRLAERLLDELVLKVDGERVELDIAEVTPTLVDVDGALDTLRLDVELSAAITGSGRLRFYDGNYTDRLGWREVTARGTEGIAVISSSVPAETISDELRAYPEELMSSPPTVHGANLRFGPGEPDGGDSAAVASTAGSPAGGGALVGFVSAPSLSAGAIALGILAAVALGAAHALAPGHGKTVTAALVAGGGGGARHAVGAGVSVAAVHTASVVALGLVIMLAERGLATERVYPWLGLVAGAVATVLGGTLVVTRLRVRGAHRAGQEHDAPTRGGIAAVAVAGGILPSPSALLVLLAAVAVGRIAFGMAMVAAFGVGLAASLVAVGLLSLRARDAVSRRLPSRLVRLLPVLTAAAITVVGVVLVAVNLPRV